MKEENSKKQSHELEELNFIFKAIKTFFIGSKLIVNFAELQHRETKTDVLPFKPSFQFQVPAEYKSTCC